MNKAIAVVVCFYCSITLATGAPVTLQVSPGQQQSVTLSRQHLNRIVTPFDSPQVRTIDQADIRIEGRVIYLSSQQTEPFVVYLTPHNNEAHALSLLVTLLDIPPREIQLALPRQWQQKLTGQRNTARKWEESTDYEQAITELLATLVKGQIPEGYELGKSKNLNFQPCQQDGLMFDFSKAQQIQGHHFTIVIGTARNHSEKPLTFHEHSCQGSGVSAVALWPHNTLYPGQRRELFLVSTLPEPESTPVVRPSLLSAP